MKKIAGKIVLVAFAGCLWISCNKFLDVLPTDKKTTEQVFETELGTNSALNGIYMFLCSNSLYGADLTMTTMDAMAQRYNITNDRNSFYVFSTYKVDEKAYKDKFSAMWSNAYKAILNTNDFITQVSKRETVLSQAKKDILLGEAHAIRAFMHFDLLRIFGPLYSIDSTSVCIPYNTLSVAEVSKQLPANQVMDSIMMDLRKAEVLLKNDPIITNGVQDAVLNDPYSNFYQYRNQRLNYYAVKALQARVLLYRVNKPGALAAAQTVLNAPLYKTKRLFPWSPYSAIAVDQDNADRIFYSEVIFGLFNSSMYDNYNAYYSSDLTDTNILTANQIRLTAASNGVFDNVNDLRYQFIWKISGTKSYPTFLKYIRPKDFTKSTVDKFKYMQPLIRKSELFYIIAECLATTDAPAARSYIDSVRLNRQLPAVASTAEVLTELQKEHIKEFFGEGQMFYYYKRQRTATIQNGSAASGAVSVYSATTGVNYYQVAIPESERTAR